MAVGTRRHRLIQVFCTVALSRLHAAVLHHPVLQARSNVLSAGRWTYTLGTYGLVCSASLSLLLQCLLWINPSFLFSGFWLASFILLIVDWCTGNLAMPPSVPPITHPDADIEEGEEEGAHSYQPVATYLRTRVSRHTAVPPPRRHHLPIPTDYLLHHSILAPPASQPPGHIASKRRMNLSFLFLFSCKLFSFWRLYCSHSCRSGDELLRLV